MAIVTGRRSLRLRGARKWPQGLATRLLDLRAVSVLALTAAPWPVWTPYHGEQTLVSVDDKEEGRNHVEEGIRLPHGGF